ncbi:MAG: hypothetical protein R6W70_04750 [bacterium]
MKKIFGLTLVFISTLFFDGPVLCAHNSGGVHVSCCCSTVAETIDIPPCCGSRCRDLRLFEGSDAIVSNRNEIAVPDFCDNNFSQFNFIVDNFNLIDFKISRLVLSAKPRPPDKHRHLSVNILIC